MADPAPIDWSRIAHDPVSLLVQLELNNAARAHELAIANLKLEHDNTHTAIMQTIADLKLHHENTHTAMMQTNTSLQARLRAKANECTKCMNTNRRHKRTIVAMKEKTKDFTKTKMKLQRALRARDIAKQGQRFNWKECKIWRKAYPDRVQGVYRRVYVPRPRPRRLILVAPVTTDAEEAAKNEKPSLSGGADHASDSAFWAGAFDAGEVAGEVDHAAQYALWAGAFEEGKAASEVDAGSSATLSTGQDDHQVVVEENNPRRSAEIIEAELYEVLMAHQNDLN